MKFPFTYERVCKGVLVLTCDGIAEIVRDGAYPGHWKFGRIYFEDSGETYSLDTTQVFDAALRFEIVTYLNQRHAEEIESQWIDHLDSVNRTRVLRDLAEEPVS